MAELRQTPLYRALHRPNLFLGGERELVLVTAIVCGGVAVSALNLVATAIGVGVWLVVIALLRLMAKADPQMSRVYLRQIGYRPYYPPRSRPERGAL
jgi:type IV secretion system protein VirB3